MIIGIGIDIVELERIEQIMERQEKFIDRILTENEKEKLFRLSDQRRIEYVAGRFATKEAYAKAVGTGIGQGLSFLDIEVLSDKNGKPIIVAPNDYKIHVSISHSKKYAIAQVILESLSS